MAEKLLKRVYFRSEIALFRNDDIFEELRIIKDIL